MTKINKIKKFGILAGSLLSLIVAIESGLEINDRAKTYFRFQGELAKGVPRVVYSLTDHHGIAKAKLYRNNEFTCNIENPPFPDKTLSGDFGIIDLEKGESLTVVLEDKLGMVRRKTIRADEYFK